MTKTWGTAWRQEPFLSSLQLLLSQQPLYGWWQADDMCLAKMTLNIVVPSCEEPLCSQQHLSHRNSLFRATQSQYMCLYLCLWCPCWGSCSLRCLYHISWSQSHWWAHPAIKLLDSNYEQKPSWMEQSVLHWSYLEVITDPPLLPVRSWRDEAACHAPASRGCGPPCSCTIVQRNWSRGWWMQCRIFQRSKWGRTGRFIHRPSPSSSSSGSRQTPTFGFAVRAEFILLQRQQRVEDSLVSVNVFHRFSRHHRTGPPPPQPLCGPCRL